MKRNSVLTRPIAGVKPIRRTPAAGFAAASVVLLMIAATAIAPSAAAATATVNLGTADPYSVLGGQTVTNTGPSSLAGNLGVSPGKAITGFPPGKIGGARHAGDAAAKQAQSDLTIAYDNAAGRAPTASVAGDLVGKTKTAGVYKSTGPLALSGTLTLDGQGNPNAVFIFQVAKTLITASASHVKVINGAQACHVFWQVASSATLGTHSVFQGTIMALASISVKTGTVVHGRALARNAAVTLDNNTFTSPFCTTTPPSSSSSPASSSSPFVPGPGLTGDSRPASGALLTEILLGVALAALLGAAFAVRSLRHRGNHS
ncbi:MAG: ice-binding family protein [Allobranchiibius sp.]